MGHRRTRRSRTEGAKDAFAGQRQGAFCFRYEVGQEAKVLDALVEWSIGATCVRLV